MKITKKIALMCLLIIVALVSFTGCGQVSIQDQVKITEVTNGVEVYACGTYPVDVRVTILVAAGEDESFESIQFYELKPGEKKVLRYKDDYFTILGLIDSKIIAIHYDMSRWVKPVAIPVCIIILVIIFVLGAKGEDARPIAAIFPIISGLITAFILCIIEIILMMVLKGPIEFKGPIELLFS